MVKCELIRDHFQNAKQYQISRADCIIADIPYNLGNSFYASNPAWYAGGDMANGASDKAGKAAFKTDYSFNIADFFSFASRLLKPEPKKGEKGAPCMIVICVKFKLLIQNTVKTTIYWGFWSFFPMPI